MINNLQHDGNQPENEPEIDDFIKLDQFLKVVGLVGTGGQAKVLIQSADIRVNGTIETRRGRKLRNGDLVEAFGESYPVEIVGENDPWA